ncbi:BlaI/MecI/CopY family transcriptional regulator [Blautia schinkii]|nr:BlaI/MecI/CopY family transcriptional regulator [Blautia schinkii]
MSTELSDTELLILKYLWSQDEPNCFADIMEHFNSTENKSWKKQTVNTFLLRMQKKEVLGVDESGRRKVYYPLISSDEYYHQYAKKVVDDNFQGSFKKFIGAFAGNHKLSDSDKAELMDYLKGL